MLRILRAQNAPSPSKNHKHKEDGEENPLIVATTETCNSANRNKVTQDKQIIFKRKGHPFLTRKPLWLLLFMTVIVLTISTVSQSLAFLNRHGIINTVPMIPALSSPANKPIPVSYAQFAQCQQDSSCTKFPKINGTFLPHDNPSHPWHWSRTNDPDPALSSKKDCKGTLYEDMYHSFHKNGYVVFESCSIKAQKDTLLKEVRDFTAAISVDRIPNAPNRAVRELSVDPDTREFIEYLHGGRRLFPYQTLNFPIGTQQGFHSDLIHFDTSPRTLMAAAWVALEDTNPDNGPLKYIPGSHLLGTNDFDEVGLQFQTDFDVSIDTPSYASFYEKALLERTQQAGLKVEIASSMKYGQSLVWAAGLVHGGSKQNNPKLSRLSQVTHYFFDGADYYWQPRTSVLPKGRIKLISRIPRCHSPHYAPSPGFSCADAIVDRWVNKCEVTSFFGLRKHKCY